jgi:hypothetical protein
MCGIDCGLGFLANVSKFHFECSAEKFYGTKLSFNLFFLIKILCLLICFRAVLVGLVVATIGEKGLQQHQQQ